VQRRPHARVRAADVVHPEAAEQVQEAVAVRVVEVRTLAARPAAIEADRPQHAHELRVDEPRVELKFRARALGEQVADAEAHVSTCEPGSQSLARGGNRLLRRRHGEKRSEG
jgi:hypothetical protein